MLRLLKSRWKAIGGIIAGAGILCLVVLVFVPSRRNLIEIGYRAEGFQMVSGCNGGAANGARFDAFTLQQELNESADVPGVNTNVIVQLRKALVIAQEMERVLRDDCARRGHRHTYPWKTNWVVVKQALDASKKLYK